MQVDNQLLFRATASEYVQIDYLKRLAIELGLTDEEASRYVQTEFKVDIDYLIGYFFHPEPAGKFPEGRFNSNRIACVYASFDEATAGAEKAHQLLENASTAWPQSIVVYSLTFKGWSWDLVSVDDRRLVGDDWSYTQLVGEEARKDAESVFAKSVRSAGQNAAIFKKYAATAGDLVEHFIFQRPMPASTAVASYNRRQVRTRYVRL